MVRTLFALSILLFSTDIAIAQSVTLDTGGDNSPLFTSKTIQLLGLVTILSLAPSLLVMLYHFRLNLSFLCLLMGGI